MINKDEFMAMAPGVPFAKKVFGEWKNQVDDDFIRFAVSNAKSMGEYKLRHAVALLQGRDLPEVREVLKEFLTHIDSGYRIAATAFFNDQLDRGYISELPDEIA